MGKSTSPDYYINVIITDAAISEFEKSNFSSFHGFSNYIHSQIQSRELKVVAKYLFTIIETIITIFGLTTTDAAIYVNRYFTEKKWSIYYPAVSGLRKLFGVYIVR